MAFWYYRKELKARLPTSIRHQVASDELSLTSRIVNNDDRRLNRRNCSICSKAARRGHGERL